MKGRINYLAYFSLLGTVVFWGVTFIWTRQVLDYYSPMTIVFIRLVLATLLLGGFSIQVKKLQKIERNDMKKFFLLAFFQPFLYFVGEGYGIKYTSSSIAAIVISTIPLFTPIGAYIFFKEKLSRMNIVGLLVSFFGVMVIILEKEIAANTENLAFGMLFLVMAVLAALGYSVLIKQLTERYNVHSINTYQNIFGSIFFIPWMVLFGIGEIVNTAINLKVVFTLIELAVFGSVLAFVFFTIGIRELGISKASAFNNAIPVVTVVAAYFWLGEIITAQKLLGMGIVLTGLFLAQIKKRKMGV